MKNWAAMYLLVWLAFLQMAIVLFPVLGAQATIASHALLGVVIVGLAYWTLRRIAPSGCPDRIKRVVRATTYIAIADCLLGLLVYFTQSVISGAIPGFLLFIHFTLAVAIITQASSSATAYDMWEEKEFLTPPQGEKTAVSGG